MTKDEAVQAVAEAMGEAKFHSYMGGAMLPRATISVEHVLEIIFGCSSKQVSQQLYRISEREFKARVSEQVRDNRKRIQDGK